MALKIAVGIPTVGRAAVLQDILRLMPRQTRQPDGIFVCGSKPDDVAGLDSLRDVTVLLAPAGLPRQRNALLKAATDADVMLFLDDDFVMAEDYVAEITRVMQTEADVVVATGHVAADGIGGPGLSIPEAEEAVRRAIGRARQVTATFSGYGCNMAVRLAPMRAQEIFFDERLPLYGWQEDVDLSRRLGRYGRVVKVEAAVGAHLGVKLGRNSGLRLGYSQVANPLYLAGKKAGYPLGRALEHIGRNLAMNLLRAARPEPYVDRRGRLRGNLLAMQDLLRRRMMPERVLDL
ncbi:glycosyltransferase family 2 protein [Acidisoma sp. 7E03]